MTSPSYSSFANLIFHSRSVELAETRCAFSWIIKLVSTPLRTWPILECISKLFSCPKSFRNEGSNWWGRECECDCVGHASNRNSFVFRLKHVEAVHREKKQVNASSYTSIVNTNCAWKGNTACRYLITGFLSITKYLSSYHSTSSP